MAQNRTEQMTRQNASSSFHFIHFMAFVPPSFSLFELRSVFYVFCKRKKEKKKNNIITMRDCIIVLRKRANRKKVAGKIYLFISRM
jgi:hypothetical protein